MQVEVENLNFCLSAAKQYETPLFQRPFAWQEERWLQLWEDLSSYYEDESNKGKAKHFMGAIVVQQRTVGGAIAHYWTIDGQQRLTTFSILLSVLRDLNENDEDIEGEVQGYLTNLQRKETSNDYLKLALGEKDRDAFTAVALRKPLDAKVTGSQITRCYEFFKKKLEEARNDEEFNDKRFYQVVRDVPQVVLITLDETDDPHIIFESLNCKGESLTSVDLIRNFVLMKFQDVNEQKQIYNELWEPIEEQLGESAKDFFFHYVCKEVSPKIPETRVYAGFKSIVESLNPSQTREKLEEIRREAGWYREFLTPENLSNSEIADKLDVFKQLKCLGVYPLLLRLRERYEEMGVDVEEKGSEYVRFLRVLCSFIVRRAFSDGQTNINNIIKTTLLREFDEAEQPFDKWLEMCLISQKGKSNRWPDDDAFRAGIKATKKQRPAPGHAKLLLGAIERKIGGKEAGNIETATIEHILPQTLSEDWRSDLGKDADDIHARYVHSYGNLTLTNSNSEMGNKSYATKRGEYRNSCFRLNRDIAQKFEEWTAREIEERADFLADQAIKIWARPDSQIGEIKFLTFADDWTHRRPKNVVWGQKKKSTKYWSDVYQATIEMICNRVRDDFKTIAKEAGLSRCFASEPGAGKFRVEMKIADCLYAEKNLSAESIRSNLVKLAKAAGLAIDDWRVELR